ncbi:MAG TPA: hypothetical protein VGF67_20260 [Ktedonobacteraceae bacterium]|jgi:hypothetical protein
MIQLHKPAIQRLWYTAPRLAGMARKGEEFRICAVTEELNQDILHGSAQVRVLERYARYTRPDGTGRNDVSRFGQLSDPFNVPGAPICLSLLDIENPEVWEHTDLFQKLPGRVLVNKVYVGEEGDGRPGNFFIDLLANVPDSFSACEALALWRSHFWVTSYISKYPGYRQILEPVRLPSDVEQNIARRLARGTSGPLSLSATVKKETAESILDPFAPALPLLGQGPYAETSEQLWSLLTFLIHAYLLQQHEDWGNPEKRDRLKSMMRQLKEERNETSKGRRSGKNNPGQQEYQRLKTDLQTLALKRIFLVAEDDWIACCLVRLARLFEHIPGLLKPLTFSTYEYDVLKSECLVVGTCPSPAKPAGKAAETLLPAACYTQGFVYDAYAPAYNTEISKQLPYIARFASFAARTLLKPKPDKDTQALAQALEKAQERLAGPALPGSQSLAWRFLDICGDIIFRPALYNRQEIEQTFDDSSKWYRLELPGVRRRIFQWIVADSQGIDLDQPAPSSIPPFSCTPGLAEKWLRGSLHQNIERFVQRRTGEPGAGSLVDVLAAETRELLEEYAHRLSQPASTLDPAGQENQQSTAASQQPTFDIVEFCKAKGFPEPFEALLSVLHRLEPPSTHIGGSPEHAALLAYLLTLENTDQGLVFRHPQAGAFVLRHLYDPQLRQGAIAPEQTAQARRRQDLASCHQRIHFRLLDKAAAVLPRDQLLLAQPLLYIPLELYDVLFADQRHLQWPRSLRKDALCYQLDQLQSRGQHFHFTGHFWETYPISPQEIQAHRDVINSQWQTHCLLLEEAQACLSEKDELEVVKPILQINEGCFGEFLELKLYPEWNRIAIFHLLFSLMEQTFQKESLRNLEAHIDAIESLIVQQTGIEAPANKEAAIDFYGKLMQSGCTEANALRLLYKWHEVWERKKILTDDLCKLIAITPISQDSLQKLLEQYYQKYKQKDAERILIDLYAKLAEQNTPKTRQQMLFLLLSDRRVSQDKLDELLKLARLDVPGCIAFFACFGPVYIPDYFKAPHNRRSPRLYQQFVNIAEDYQNAQKQAEKTGPAVERNVLLSILWIWLSAPGAEEAEQVKSLIQCIRPNPSELVSILAAFGDTYMLARKPGLTTLCRELSRQLFQQQHSSAEKLLVLFTLLQPELCPPQPQPLSAGETLGFLRSANLAQTQAVGQELQMLLGKQQKMASRRSQDLVEFLRRAGYQTDSFSLQLQRFLEKHTGRTGDLVSAIQAHLQAQSANAGYQPGELEFFLEVQEKRLQLSAGLLSQKDFTPAAYLNYLLLPAAEQSKETEPFKEYYLHYLQEFHVDGFTQRAQTSELLKILSATPAMIDPRISKLAEGWLDIQDFLAGCQNVLHAQMYPQIATEASSLELTGTLLDYLEEGWQALHMKSEDIARDVHQRLVIQIASAIAPCITQQEHLAIALRTRLSTGKTLNQSYWMELLHEMSTQTSKSYRQQPDVELLLPYIEILPRLHDYFSIHGQAKETFCFTLWDILLLPQGHSDMQALRQLEKEYDKWQRSVKSMWKAYLQARNLQVDRVEPPAPQTPPVPVATPTQPVTPLAPLTPSVPVQSSVEISGIKLWWKSLIIVGKVRRAIRKARIDELDKLWKDEYALLLCYEKRIEPAYWRRFAEIRQLYEAFETLHASPPNLSSDEQRAREWHFLSQADICQKSEQEEGWKACASPQIKSELELLRPFVSP